MLVHCSVTPSIKFTGAHLYTWVESGTARVQPKNTTQYPSQDLTWTSQSGVKHTKHEATAPPSSLVMLLLIIYTIYTSGGMTKSDESQTCTPPYSASGLLLFVKFVSDSPFTFVVTEL